MQELQGVIDNIVFQSEDNQFSVFRVKTDHEGKVSVVYRGPAPFLGESVELSGSWGEHAKFGLDSAQLLAASELLHQEGLAHCLRMVHTHIGSQVPDITSIQGMTMDQSEIERHAEQMREKIDKLYLSKLDGFANAEVIVREGIPYVEILKVARENEADLIVMAHHSSDLSDDDADIGSTVEQVVLRSACPVASVTRPEAR